MALYPCSVGMHKYAGKQQSIYAALVNGNRSFRRKQRLCPAHFDAQVELLDNNYRVIDVSESMAEESPYTDRLCNVCAGDNAQWSFFATAYGKTGEPRAYWAPLCETDAEDVSRDFNLGL